MKPGCGRERKLLEQFLAARLPEAEEHALAEHLAECPACQAVLRDLEADLGVAELVQRQTESDVARPSAEFLDRLRQARPDPDSDAVLPEVEGYEMLGILGRGGMGTVYWARHKRLNRLVALKFPPLREDRKKQDERRLRAEAKAVAALNHPNIVQIHEIGGHEGRPFLCLEFCPGGSLAGRLSGSSEGMSPRLAAHIIEVLARALHHAHQHHIVHRDLKPSNILLDSPPGTSFEDCLFKVADFGLAKQLQGATAMTSSGAILGTADYMAPEQAQGDKEVGPAADIHALGAMLYEMLTGRPPFKAGTIVETLVRVVQDEPTPLRRLRPKVSRDLETICLKCLEKSPKERYASAEALADDLRRFLDGEAIEARPPSMVRKAGRWLRRHRLGLVAALVIAVVSVGAWKWVEHTRSREQDMRANLRTSLHALLQEINDQSILSKDHLRYYKDLEAKAALYESIFPEGKSDPTDREQLADVYVRLGWLDAIHGDKTKAADFLQKARTIYTDLSTADPNRTSTLAKRANACNDLGMVFVLQDQREQARESFGEAIRIDEQLTADFPGETDYILSLALVWSALGELNQSLKDNLAAEGSFARAAKLMRQCVEAQNPDLELSSLLANSLIQWGVSLDGLGRSEEAEQAFGQALTVLDRSLQPRAFADVLDHEAAPILHVMQSGRGRRSHSLRQFLSSTTSEKESNVQKLVNHYVALNRARPGQREGQRNLARSYYYLAITAIMKPDGIHNGLSAARRGTTLYEELCRANPDQGIFALEAAQLYCYISAVLLGHHDDEEVGRWCDQGLYFLDTAILGKAQAESAKLLRHDLLIVRANVRNKNERFLEALRDLEAAFQCDPATRTRSPVAGLYALLAARAREHLVVDLLRQGRLPEAMKETDELAKLPSIPGEALYDGACVFGIAAGAAKDAMQREQCAARAVQLLRMAFKAGFGKDAIQKASGMIGTPIQHMEKDNDLVAVRGRADYRRLRDELIRGQ